MVAPKVSGRVERMLVDLADPVRRGQVVAELDNGEYVQAVAQARADLEVARATLSEAGSALEIADRELRRTESLLKRGIASDSQMDAAEQAGSRNRPSSRWPSAQVTKAQASLEAANIRLGYTQVTAGWAGPDPARVVAERYVDEGQTVAANTPLLSIVELGSHRRGDLCHRERLRAPAARRARLAHDGCLPGRELFRPHRSHRPVFREATRQARVEMTIENSRQRLKPGMFIRATVVLESVPEAVIVPEQALTTRDGRSRGLYRQRGRPVRRLADGNGRHPRGGAGCR